ncbi:MAG: HlyD family secretion protein [Deltaproteobacteria bacterium]|nr:HlyD family secretion protein [Deltaproteobacteria bacterium]
MAEVSSKNHQRLKKGIIILCLLGVVGLIVGVTLYRYSQTHIKTDDAHVAGSVYALSFRVPGTIATVKVHDNQLVEAGQEIATLDPTDYDVAYKQAQANLESIKARWASAQMAVPLESEQTRARVKESTAGVGAFQKNLQEAQEQLRRVQEETKSLKAILNKATLDRDRFDGLFKNHAVSRQQLDEALTQYLVAEARFKAALAGEQALHRTTESLKEQINRAKAQVDLAQTGERAVKIKQQQAQVAKSELALAEARLEQARLQLSYTRIKAPARGHITKKNLEVGNQVQAGQPLMALVPLENLWIVANYKETQLTRVIPGQKVTIKVDTFSGEKLRGRVESIMAGTGSAFSLFPPENATGNFVKIVQRIPVKIVLDPDRKDRPQLRVGMSVIPTILINEK